MPKTSPHLEVSLIFYLLYFHDASAFGTTAGHPMTGQTIVRQMCRIFTLLLLHCPSSVCVGGIYIIGKNDIAI